VASLDGRKPGPTDEGDASARRYNRGWRARFGPGGRVTNELARFLAGLPGEAPCGLLDAWRRSAAWMNYADAFARAYAVFQDRCADPFSRWAHSVSRPAWRERSVFYPFSGPDFLFAQFLHPAAETYMLCGRERWTPLPSPPDVEDVAMLAVLTPLGEFVEPYLTGGFFVTQDMAAWLASHADFGIAHILLALASRQGFSVPSVRIVWVDHEGRLTANAGCHATTGICIDLQRSGRAVRVLYFQHDLRNGYFSPASPLAKFVAAAAPCLSLCKCASYLPHEPEFSDFGRFMLGISSALVQDASGVPYRLLKDGDWDIALHGRYATPLRVFERYDQPDLSEAFDRAAATTKSLEFSVGYGRNTQRAGLIVARSPTPIDGGGMFRPMLK